MQLTGRHVSNGQRSDILTSFPAAGKSGPLIFLPSSHGAILAEQEKKNGHKY